MSTRCQIIIRDECGEDIWLYRHSDGYPDGVKPTLDKFCELVLSGKIRNESEYSSGYLMLLGVIEYEHMTHYADMTVENFMPTGYKIGAYTNCPPRLQGDIEYLSIIAL